LVEPARVTADALDATLINMRFVKPLDEALLLELAASHDHFVTLEDNAVAGGAGSAVAEFFATQGMEKPLLHIGIPDRFVEHGSREECLKHAGLDADSIRQAVTSWLADRAPDTRRRRAART
ncbi:MAG: transketolase C-terminal domain-containing protein, partial [Gammaproteobacteria bacterium]